MAPARPLAEVSLEPPLPNGRETRIFAIGANFACHLALIQSSFRGVPVSEDEARAMFKAPWGFHLLADTVIGQGGRVEPPRGVDVPLLTSGKGDGHQFGMDAVRRIRSELRAVRESLRSDWKDWRRLCDLVLEPQPT